MVVRDHIVYIDRAYFVYRSYISVRNPQLRATSLERRSVPTPVIASLLFQGVLAQVRRRTPIGLVP
jgi:hypothetical protein